MLGGINPSQMKAMMKQMGIKQEDIDADEYVTMVKRPFGTLADIVRSIDRYRAVGNETGLRLVEDVPMPPTEKLMQTVPRYRGSAGKPMTHLLRFIVEK